MSASEPELALFDPVGVGPGPVESAMLASLRQWASAAVVVTSIGRASLLAQAHAVDLALRAGRPTNVSGANRVLLELMTGLGLVGQKVPGPDDELDKLIEKLSALPPPTALDEPLQ